jgi:2-dehydro-3-deoxyphosphogluconate aldolase/(4S)-4-hydroxy-2-oxoglutarate aldolase
MTISPKSTKRFDPTVIGILRGVEKGFFGELMQTSFNAGLQALEVTINTPDAARIVSENRHLVPENAFLGMGTVRNIEEAKIARDAGSMFFVTPNLNTEVIEFAVKQDIPIVAGALTPTEVYTAWQAGADMVKVFPCGAMGGARYIRDLLGPFDDLKLAAVGGVTLENLGEYFAAGAASVGVSSALFGQRALQEKNLTLLADNVTNFIERCRSFSTKININ